MDEEALTPSSPEAVEKGRSGEPYEMPAQDRALMLVLAIAALVMPVFGVLSATQTDCDAIMRLFSAFMITFGLVQVVKSFLAFVFKVPFEPSKQQKNLPTNCVSALGLLSIAMAVWGVAITAPRVGELPSDECSAMYFYTAFITAAANLAIPLAIAIGFCVAMALRKT